MTLPSTGQLSFLHIRNNIDKYYPNVNWAHNRVLLVGPSSVNTSGDDMTKWTFQRSASNYILERTSGQTSVSELRGKSAEFVFVKYTQTYMTGFWVDDILIPEGANMDLTISEEDYLELYEDGLVDQPPVEFFARLTSKPDETLVSAGKIGPEIDGFKINSVVERTVDYHTTEGMFEVTVAGHDVPLDWIVSLEFINSETDEVFETLVGDREGDRVTAATGKQYTFWAWPCAKGQMFPEGVEVVVKLETKEGTQEI